MRNNTTVHDIMGVEYVGVSESDTVRAATELMLDEGVDAVVVLRGREPVGTMTCHDALSTFLTEGRGAETPVGDVMSETAPRVDSDASVDEALSRLLSESAERLLVYDEGDLVSVITGRDLVSATTSRGIENGVHAADEVELAPDGSDSEYEDVPEYSTQSICEVCGSLVRDLSNLNGQLVCADCRDV